MKHGVRFWNKKLNRTPSHRKSLMQNMLTELVKHERIETTLPKAKMLKYEMERMVNYAKKGDEFSLGQLQKSFRVSFINQSPELTIPKMTKIIANRYQDRKGGYVRILKNGYRSSGSDRAPLALIELVNNPRDIVYHLAKNHIAPLEKQLIDVESKKYHRKVIKLWNLETGEKEGCIQLLPRNDLTPLERISLSKSENTLRKRLNKYKKSLSSFPAAREADEASFATTDGSIPLLKASYKQDTLETPIISDRPLKSHTDVPAISAELESKVPSKAEPSKPFMEKYFGRFWKK